jgi:hypothetical protein
MPRRGPKKTLTAFRLDPELLQAVREDVEAAGTNVTAIVEDGLRAWLKRQKRKAGKADPLAQHLAPPTRREIAARAAAEPAPATPRQPDYRRPTARETAPREGAG